MKVTVESSTLLRPDYGAAGSRAAGAGQVVPLSPFDRVSDDFHYAVFFGYRPPAPPNAAFASSLAKALAAWPEWAGRIGRDPRGRPVIVLNDAGVRFVEAVVDADHDESMEMHKPSPAWMSLHPTTDGVEELLQVQLTRFRCGTLVMGLTFYHPVADGQAVTFFFLHWCHLCRGGTDSAAAVPPRAIADRAVLFQPRSPPVIEFPHRGVEVRAAASAAAEEAEESQEDDKVDKNVVTLKAHFSNELLEKLREKTSKSGGRRYSTVECLVSHLWTAMTKARRIPASTTTRLRVSVNGRTRMNPPAPSNFSGNLVLWAYPQCAASELTAGRALHHTADVIRREIAKVDDRYFKSLIDFVSVEDDEGREVAAMADPSEWQLAPNVEVDSWLQFPFRLLDFGGGAPFYFRPTYFPVEGHVLLLPSFDVDDPKGIDVFLSLFEDDMAIFRRLCFAVDAYGDSGEEPLMARL